MAFGENSWMSGQNGNDMKWNPTSVISEDPRVSNFSNIKMGGMHYIYVFGNNNSSNLDPGPNNNIIGNRYYDDGKFLISKLFGYNLLPNTKKDAWKDCMWVGLPLLAEGKKLLDNDVRIKLRVESRYQKNYSASRSESSPTNKNYPKYKFDTKDLYTESNNADAAKKALEAIRVVPNPYYAYSQYEINQLDNRVKVVNLPAKCTIKIYNLAGTLVRTFEKDDPQTFLDWDLKNQAGIPVASGMYLIHVNVDGVGEKIVKFMGMMRPIDLDNF